MVKCHEGFINQFVAVSCMNACLLHYVSQGFLCGVYASPETSSFELSVHHKLGEHIPLIKGLFPSAYSVRFVNKDTPVVSLVTNLYFGIAKQMEDEL